MSFNGQDIKGSPFRLDVHCVSARKSYLDMTDLGPLPGTSEISLDIVAVDEDGTLLEQGGDQFTASVTVNGKPQVSMAFFLFSEYFLEGCSCSCQAAPTISDQNNGTYTLSFTPTVSGACAVSVKFKGKEIGDSRVAFWVLASDFFGAGKQLEVLYDAKVHKFSNATFHKMCDQAKSTVTLVTLKNGAKFGGYNPNPWKPNGNEGVYGNVNLLYFGEMIEGAVPENASTAFLFSLTDGKGSAPKKFPLHQGYETQAVTYHPSRGPYFGGLLSLSFLQQVCAQTFCLKGSDLVLTLDGHPSGYFSSHPSAYQLPSYTALSGSQAGSSAVDNVQVFSIV